MDFEWDSLKEAINLKKHRISFFEALESFFDPNAIKLIDIKHSKKEKRYYWVGKSKSEKILTTWFTIRKEKIRIIGSAEWRKFRRLYYEATKINRS